MASEPKLLTILFADICGSTTVYETLGDSQALSLINECLNGLMKIVTDNGGKVVKTVGDAVVSSFADSDSGLNAASAMQSWRERQSSTNPSSLLIRVGLSYGPVIETEDDIFGDNVNLCARVVALANPRQILTTRHTVEALSTYLRPTCRELYSITVKGKAEKISVFEVIWKQDANLTVITKLDPVRPEKVSELKISHLGETWTVNETQRSLSIGRDRSSDIVVAAGMASRNHARIFRREGKYVLADNSSNGTYLKFENGNELFLRKEESVLVGRGVIGLGQPPAMTEEGSLSFEVT